jgi:hypothetical protein
MSKSEDQLMSMYTEEGGDLEIRTITYDPTGMPNSQNAINKAKLENLIVVFPEPNQLFIDLDNEISYQMFIRQFQIFQKFIDKGAEVKVTTSKSGLPKQHATVRLSFKVTEEKRILFQALLGSDRVRELLGYVQETNGDPHPTLFLEAGPKQLPDYGQCYPDAPPLTDEDCPF